MALRKLEIVEYYDRNGILKLTLNRHPYFADTKKLKDWTYGYDQRYGKIENFYRSKNEYELNIGVAGDSLAARDELSDIFNADVLAGEPGTLKIRGWALKCYITEAEYEFGVRIDRTSKYKVIAVTPGWTREAVHSYDGTETGGSGTDYGRNYSFNSNVLGRGYDYGYDEYAAHSATITLTGDNNGFELMIYGPAIDPVVYVNNDPVKVFVTLNSTERLRIVSDGSIKTIDVLQADGSSESAFVFRDKEHKLYSYYVARNLDELMGYKMYQTAGTVEDFLSKFEDELPYETYEVFYDWGWDGWQDGYNLVCFYEKGPGYLHENWGECSRYNEEYLSELNSEEKEKYEIYLESKSEENRLKRMAENNAEVLRKIKMKNEKSKIRNLSICPLTPDPPEILELIAELKEYLKTVECDYIGTYDAYFNFDFGGITYKMDYSALSTSPDHLFTAKDQIVERLEKIGASSITYSDRWD